MRKPRKLEKGAKYHVRAKINRGEFVFKPVEIKILFMYILKRSKKKYKFSLNNFVILNNCIEFIIQPLEEESLSRIMQWILSVFAMHFNAIYELNGHVWQDRFWSRIINNIGEFMAIFNSISENPVIMKIVEKADEYKFGGLYYLLKGIFDIIDKPTEGADLVKSAG